MSATQQVPLSHRAGRGSVLIVDDVLLVRMWIAEFLRGRGFEVIEAARRLSASSKPGLPSISC
jgi:hypothetical protein